MPNTAVRAAGEAMPAAKKLTTMLLPDELPDVYAMDCAGTCMEPDFPDGCKLLFSRTEPYAAGDPVALFKRPELVKPGEHQVIVKRLVMMPPPWVKFPHKEHPKSEVKALVIAEQLNPRRQFAIECDKLLGIHKCLGLVPADMRTYRVSDDEVRARASQRT